jgi:hypothetical protein
VLKGMEGDKGLVIKDKAAHHAISAKFPKAIDNKGQTLVVQYEVKLQGKPRVHGMLSWSFCLHTCRRLGVWWCVHEATPGQQSASR